MKLLSKCTRDILLINKKYNNKNLEFANYIWFFFLSAPSIRGGFEAWGRGEHVVGGGE